MDRGGVDVSTQQRRRVSYMVRTSKRNGNVLGAMLYVPSSDLEALGFDLEGLESIRLAVESVD